MKVGIIGLGHGSRVLVKSFKYSKFKIYAISSKDYNKAKQINKIIKADKVYKNWKDLVDDNKILIVAIAVPPILQPLIIKRCIKKNKKIFAEKPLSSDYNETKKILNKLLLYNNHFIIDYIFPEHELFKKFYKIINGKVNHNNSIIKIFFSNKSYVLKNKIKSWKSQNKMGGGLINLYLIHIIDYLILYFGKIKSVYKNSTKNDLYKLELLIVFQNKINVHLQIDSDNKNQRHYIIYENKENKILLKNNGSDYIKNFKLTKIFLNKIKNYENRKFYKFFRDDGRILLSSSIANKFKKKFDKSSHIALIKRYKIVEKWINKVKKLYN